MAESGNEVSWWDWAKNTKDKVVSQSSEVLGYVKKDIGEFATVISDEASSVVSSTASVFREKLSLDESKSKATQMKNSMSSFFSHVAEVFIPPPDDGDVEAIMICNQRPVFLNRLQVAIYQVCSDHSNFLKDPEEEKQYVSWLQTFSLENHQHELSELLHKNEPLRQTYTELVPTQVSHVLFWQRYYFKLHKLDEAEGIRAELKLQAKNSTEDVYTVWDEDDDFISHVDIPEQMQKHLLEEYEKECKNGINQKDSSEISELTAEIQSNSCDTVDESHFGGYSEKDQDSSSPSSSKDTEEGSWDKLHSLETELLSIPQLDKNAGSSKNEDWENWQ